MLSTTLTAGAGTEQFVLNVVRNAPIESFRIVIVQTDMQDKARLDSQYVANVMKATKLYTIRSFRRHLRPFDYSSNYATLVMRQLATYLLNVIYKRLNGPTLKQIRDSDLIYLIRNDDLPYLTVDKKKTVLLGSTHCSTLTLSSERRGLRRLRKLFRVLKYRRIDGFHFTSAKWQRDAILRKKYDFVLPLGIDTDLYHLSDTQRTMRGKVRFLFVSRLEHDKGVTRLLDAWNLTDLRDAELHIAGTGSLEELVRSRADDKRVIYHGVLSNQDLAELYRSCDIFVFPTHGEIYGLVVLEALASGLFGILSEDLKGNFDEFEKMGMAEYVRNDPRAISECMLRIAGRRVRIRDNQQRVFDYIRENHDWRSLSAGLFSTFERILEQAS